MKLHYPAEWEPQKAIWLAFPHNEKNWRGENRARIFEFYYKLIEIVSRFQKANVLVPQNFELPADKKRLFANAAFKPKFIPLETDDIWIRDYGPFFVYNESGHEKVAKFLFNAWGEKFPPWESDSQVPRKIAERAKLAVNEYPYIFEGGAIEVNGEGLGMTTLPCLVGEHRNPKADIKKVQAAICEALGLEDLLILPDGLCGDHTDGHIDNVARFVAPERVVLAWEADQSKPNFERLLRNRTIVETWLKRHYGESAKVDTLQIPTQRKLGDDTLPASYMNFIFLNGAVVYPRYEKPFDDLAEAYFAKVFPERQIVGIECDCVIREGGSLHCLSKQEN